MPHRTAATPMPPRTAGQIVAIGECMVELNRVPDGTYRLAFGGDTFNTAVYMARAGLPVAYATALGDDPYSCGIMSAATAEGIDPTLMTRLAGRMPGLYLIETTAGERSFWYWRERAAARDLFETSGAPVVTAAMAESRLIYFSGITLSLYSARGIELFAEALAAAKAAGATIAMDSNYRPRGWGGDAARARATFARFWALADIALPTFDDEQALWSDAEPAATADRLVGLGVAEIAIKNGAAGAFLVRDGRSAHVPCPAAVAPVDTTAAGDSFNAAYIARRLAGADQQAAAAHAHRLAGIVIQHRGAIVPAAATADLLR